MIRLIGGCNMISRPSSVGRCGNKQIYLMLKDRKHVLTINLSIGGCKACLSCFYIIRVKLHPQYSRLGKISHWFKFRIRKTVACFPKIIVTIFDL